METLTALASRRSTRAFTPKQVTTPNIDTILGAGSSAPIALGKYDNVHFTVIQDAKLLKLLSGNADTPFYNAPTLVLISAKATPYPNIEFFNAGCIMENMFLAATALGLGSVFISGASEVAKGDPALLSALNLPKGYAPVAAVALGYAETPLETRTEFKNSISINWLI